MIQSQDYATFEGKQVKVLWICPYGVTAKVDINGQQRKVPYKALKDPKTNSYHVNRTDAEKLKDFAVEVQKVYKHCIDEIARINAMSNPNEKMLVRKSTLIELGNMLNEKLKG